MSKLDEYLNRKERINMYPDTRFDGLSPIRVSDLSGRGPFDGPYWSQDELVGREFIILEARKVPGKFGDNEWFYHCQCVDPVDDNPFHTSLSGKVVNEVIEQWQKEAGDWPLVAKLLRSSNAAGVGYYDLE